MLKENQSERAVLFYEEENGRKVQFEYGMGITLTEVAETFKNFLVSSGFTYVTDVIISGPNGSWTSEPSYHPGHEEQMITNTDDEEDIPF